MTALIELVCRTHLVTNGPGPLITLVDQKWAYCGGHGNDGHEWTRIEPTRRDHLGEVALMQERQAS